jgi:hypothetical protein
MPGEVENPMRLALCLCTALATAADANDSAGGLTATGLVFGQTDQVVMVEEDLFIGLDRIAVDYVFRNVSDRDFTTEVIFPMPPISLEELSNSDFNLPPDLGQVNLLNFTVTLDGLAVPVQLDRIAVMAPGWDRDRPLAAQYDTPGDDVTALLRNAGITELSTDPAVAAREVLALPVRARQRLEDAGLIWLSTYGGTLEATPLWSVALRFHWTQTFPAGAEVRISHGYDNRPTKGNISWKHGGNGEYHDLITRLYCVDEGTSKAMEQALNFLRDGKAESFGYAVYTDYVLRTANSWAGPIGKFRLTLDKGDPGNVISLCIDGVTRTGPTTFVVEKTDFVPDRDLEILVVEPSPAARGGD